MPRQIRLTLNLQATGRHDAAWKTLEPTSDWLSGIDYYSGIAQLAERGRFDALFIADRIGSLEGESVRRPWRGADPTVLLAALARETSHIGLAATSPAIHGSPFALARSIATLDHVSKGRAAWNIITSQEETTRRVLGVDEVLDQEARYRKAGEFIEIVDALWASLPYDAVVADGEADRYVDVTRTRPVDIEGEFYSSAGILPLPGGFTENRPVIFHAGTSTQSKALAARWADALFTSQLTADSSRQFSQEVKQLAADRGRHPDSLLVLPGLLTVIGSTEAEALARKAELDELLAVEPLLAVLSQYLDYDVTALPLDGELPYSELSAPASTSFVTARRGQLVANARAKRLSIRQLLFNNITGGQRVIIGTPEQIADDIVDWVDTGASDGFTINIDHQPTGFEQFIDGVVGELQQRGRFRTEYEHDTLRGTLGLAEFRAFQPA